MGIINNKYCIVCGFCIGLHIVLVVILFGIIVPYYYIKKQYYSS